MFAGCWCDWMFENICGGWYGLWCRGLEGSWDAGCCKLMTAGVVVVCSGFVRVLDVKMLMAVLLTVVEAVL